MNKASAADVMRRIVQVLSFLILQNVLLFVSAGTLNWIWAWVFAAINVVILTVNALLMPAELIAERGKKHPDAERWDRILTSIAAVPIFGAYVVTGLDFRFGWSPEVPFAARITAAVVYFSGSMLFTWAMLSNRYFSTQVRLQWDRSHTVQTGGPYRFVRHPGYLAYLIFSPALVILLGSTWGLICSFLTQILFIARTKLEDDTLMKKLPGYSEYAARVRYRIFPGLW